MKKNILLASALLLAAGAAQAQDKYDLARIAGNDLNGTARYIGMGGAMGALGADITSMNTNPAGLGIYRSNDIAISADFKMLNAGNLNQNDNVRSSINQVGVAIASKYSNYSSLKYVNYGFSYRRRTNFFDDFTVNDNWYGEFSQTHQMADLTYGEINTQKMPMLPALAIKANVLGTNADGNYCGVGAFDTSYSTNQTGGVHDYDFSIAFNWEDKYFLGASLGYSHVSFDRTTWYTEYGDDDYSYDMTNYYRTRGSGMNFKLGGIIRPMDDNNFRVGLALKSPTFYLLTDESGVDITAYDANNKEIGSSYADVDAVDYQMNTPWQFNLSVGSTWDNKLAFGAEYELENYRGIQIHERDGYDTDYTAFVRYNLKDQLKTVHTFKVGAEYKVTPSVALRAGYNYSTAVFDQGAYRSLREFADIYIDTFSETSYANTKSLQRFTCGLGYRTSSFYMDLAYQYNMQKADFFAFDDMYTDKGVTYYVPATEISKNHSNLTLTFGYRF